MNHFLRRRRCCCGPCPCVVTDDFAADSIADYDVTTGAGFVVASGVLSSTGTGAATRLVEFPGGTRQIGARAALTNNSHTSFGLIIGEGDNRIEWMWDTAGTQCTLTVTAAGSAILTQSYAGAPTSTLEVTMTGSDGAWDITVSRDGSAVATHSAVAVTFAANWIPVGVTSTGGGTWDDLCLISCEPLCVALESECANGNELPVVWTLDAGTVTDTVEGPPVDGFDTLCCSLLSGEWLVVRQDYTYLLATSLPSTCAVTDIGTGPLTACQWVSAIQGYENEVSGWCSTGDAVDSRWFMYGVVPYDADSDAVFDSCDYFLHDENCTPLGDTASGPCALLPAWSIELEFQSGNTEVRLSAVGAVNIPYPGFGSAGDTDITATYKSAWETVPHDYTVGTTTLSLTSTTVDDDFPDDACSWPATITATTASRTVTEQVLQCRDRPFCVGLESEAGVLQLRGTIGGEAFVACLNGPVGWSNDGPWSGSLDGADLIGTCAGIDFSFELFCKTISDTEKEWTLRVRDTTNAVTIDLPFEPDAPPGIAGTASGTLTGFCGGDQAFAATVSDFTGGNDPLAACCTDPNIALLCGLDGSINATGSFPTGTCGCDPHTESLSLTTGAILCGGTPIAPTGFDDTANYYRGDFPFDGTFSFVGWELLLYCDAGTMRWAALDGSGCVQGEGVVTWDCEAMTGTTGNIYGGMLLGCCMDDIGTAEINFG